MTTARGMKEVGYFDCPGGGQVVVRDEVAYVGHMGSPHGTSIIDVSDPARPRALAKTSMPAGMRSHKVRVENGLMVVNRECPPPGPKDADFPGGIDIYDVSRPAEPRKLATWPALGMHRFTFDGRYVYGSPHLEGYRDNIVMIIDLQNPERPEEVGRWWMPGQWEAGGEEAAWDSSFAHKCHHPIRLGNRLYVSYWHGGFVILDIEDMSAPKLVSGLDWSPPFPWPTHTALPVPFRIRNRQILLVADEDVVRNGPDIPAFLWLVDITDEKHPMPFASFQVEEEDGSDKPDYTGLHQFCEEIRDTEIPTVWFAHGLKIVDIANPHAPREVASFLPPVPPGAKRISSNDVCVDGRGLIYLIDRQRGMHILERI